MGGMKEEIMKEKEVKRGDGLGTERSEGRSNGTEGGSEVRNGVDE